MDKKYQVYYKVFNEEKQFAFETDDLLGIKQIIEYYLRRWIMIDCFYSVITFFVYEKDKLIMNEQYACSYPDYFN